MSGWKYHQHLLCRRCGAMSLKLDRQNSYWENFLAIMFSTAYSYVFSISMVLFNFWLNTIYFCGRRTRNLVAKLKCIHDDGPSNWFEQNLLLRFRTTCIPEHNLPNILWKFNKIIAFDSERFVPFPLIQNALYEFETKSSSVPSFAAQPDEANGRLWDRNLKCKP